MAKSSRSYKKPHQTGELATYMIASHPGNGAVTIHQPPSLGPEYYNNCPQAQAANLDYGGGNQCLYSKADTAYT